MPPTLARGIFVILRQLYDPTSSTYTYVLGCEKTGAAVVIDAVFDQFDRDAALIHELNLELKYVLDTHVHADHVTAAWRMKEAFGAKIVLSGNYDAEGVDISVAEGDVIEFGDETLTVLETPGHTEGCTSYVTADRSMVFTGDCLMIRGAGRTDFQGGNVDAMWHSIRDKLFSLPDACVIYPAHDYHGRTTSSIGEEKHFNPRIGGDAHEEDFSGFMHNLGLPHPKMIEEAVPANMKSGQPDSDLPRTINWGPVSQTFAGIPEIEPEWVASHLDDVYLLDVRSQQEFASTKIEGAHLIPLDELRDRVNEVPNDKPVVAVCQSGKRSAMACQILRSAGYEKVANLPGGIVDWMRMALPLN